MKEEILDKIEAYLNGKMSADEEKAFDAAIEQDPELATAVDNFGLANDAIELLIEDNLRKELDELRAEETSNESSNVVSINKNKPVARMRSLRTYLAAAASVAVLLGFFGINWAGSNYSNDALASEYSDAFAMPSNRSNGTLDAFSEGFTAYTEGDFNKAVQFFQGVVVDDPRYAEAQYYLGHSFQQNGNHLEAANRFENVVKLADIRFVEQAEWNQVLALLAANQTDNKFQTLLNKIANDENHTFNNRAVALRDKMNSFWRKLVL